MPPRRRATLPLWLLLAALAAAVLAGCGGKTRLIEAAGPVEEVQVKVPAGSSEGLTFPVVATKNTTRVAGSDPVADAAAVALAVFPSAAPGTHPPAVTL